MKQRRRRLAVNRWFWLAALVGLLLDQLTKNWVTSTFAQEFDTIPILPGIFHFTYVTNSGAAFSLFTGGADWLRWLSLGVSVGLMLFAWYSPPLRLAEQLGYGFILAGAIGNGVCRFLYSYVIDFLDFRLIQFPVFNLADVFINIGIVCLLYAMFRSPSHLRS
ncbi:signal peptidase II [Spirulina subsalsa FACHB-351]|uniref:Lipoprotein signal peptidase n=1 Tax=Spirulina subsalsa FACHB-351 TaxID=234711 RepID=A0ABT3L098_9CYAN|nr:signal peptidase II [Spirulina subsalsa]MCW6034926.1 signal peptidase II [Spirulina subsalsa FACHB-351]